MLLGASSAAIESPADAGVVMSEDHAGESGVAAGPELLAFTDAAHRLDDQLVPAREALAASLGTAAMVDAAVIAAVFRGLNIAADTSGIRVDESWEDPARGLMASIGTDRFRTAENSPAL